MKSVYIHIPFCQSICSYCDFSKFYYREDWVKEYLKHLEIEVDTYYQYDPVYTIYIGGGTPSVLSYDELKQLFSIIDKFDLREVQEFTFECNIENITEEKARFLIEHGVTRISIGVETFLDKYLGFLNRHHKKSEVKEKIEMLKRIGFSNINVDLIYAVPNETLEELKFDLDSFLELDIPHISIYSLMIEPHTMLGVHHVEEISEDLDREMYEMIEQVLVSYGFIHYEISNFGKLGYFSKHNLVYWNNQEYYGFGLGASGYIDSIRYDNTKNFSEYIKGNYRKEFHSLSVNEMIENELILGFRKLDGISIQEFRLKYGIDISEHAMIKQLLKEGKLVIEDGYIKIEKSCVYISNQILCQLIGEKYE